MAASKMGHAGALRNNRAKCAQYRAEGRRERNKARRAAVIAARLARKKAKREAKSGASAPAPKEVKEIINDEIIYNTSCDIYIHSLRYLNNYIYKLYESQGT